MVNYQVNHPGIVFFTHARTHARTHRRVVLACLDSLDPQPSLVMTTLDAIPKKVSYG